MKTSFTSAHVQMSVINKLLIMAAEDLEVEVQNCAVHDSCVCVCKCVGCMYVCVCAGGKIPIGAR